ncbi:MAG: flagellar export protein FliJ [Ignavibacteria bacterium]
MTKPITRFSTLVRVKQHQEKLTQQQLMQIRQSHLQEKEMLDRLQEAREEAVKDTYGTGRAKAHDLQIHRAFIFRLTREINRQTTKVNEMKEQEEAKREELTQRAQARQMVEKLDEKSKHEAMRELERKEQHFIDELAQRSNKKSDGRLVP